MIWGAARGRARRDAAVAAYTRWRSERDAVRAAYRVWSAAGAFGEPLAPDKKKYGENGILWTDQFTALYPIMR